MKKFIKNNKDTVFLNFLMFIIYIISSILYYTEISEAKALINLGVFLTITISLPVFNILIANSNDLNNKFKFSAYILFVALVLHGLYITTFGDMINSCENGDQLICYWGKIFFAILYILISFLIWSENKKHQDKQEKEKKVLKDYIKKIENNIIKSFYPLVKRGDSNMDPIIFREHENTYVLNNRPIIDEFIIKLRRDMINHAIDNYNKKDDNLSVIIKKINNMDENSILSLYLKQVYPPKSEVIISLVEQINKNIYTPDSK